MKAMRSLSFLSKGMKRTPVATNNIFRRSSACFSTIKSAELYKNNVAEYNDKGYTVIGDVLSKDEIGCAQEHIDWLLKKYPDVHPELLEHWFVRNDPFWLSLVSHDKLLDVVSAFLETNDIALFASHYVCKLGKSGKPIHWHQGLCTRSDI